RTLAADVWILHPWRAALHGDCRGLGAAVVSRVRALLLFGRRAVVRRIPVARLRDRTALATCLAHSARHRAVRVRAALRRACAGAVFQLAADAAGHQGHAASAGLKPHGTGAMTIARSDRPRSTDEAPRGSG